MNLNALRVFLDLVQTRCFTETAGNTGLTQSAVSQVIKKLEERVGTQLFSRSKRPLNLTEVGQFYSTGCKRLLEQFDELEATILQSPPQLPERVRVAAIYSVGLGNMGQYVERFKAAQPNVEVHIEYFHPDRVYERVLEGTADFGLVSFPQRSGDIQISSWRDEEMVLACTPRHPLAALPAVRPEQLAGEKFIGFDKELVIRKQVDKFLRQHGVRVEVVMQFDNIETIKKAIDEAAGIALLPEPTLRGEVQAGTLVAVPLLGCQFLRALGFIQRRRHKLTAAAQRFQDLLRQREESISSPAEPKPFASGSPRGRNGATRKK